jgi:hypothetical protein
MTRLSLLLSLAVLAEAGIALLVDAALAAPLQALVYGLLGAAAAFRATAVPPFFAGLALGIAALGAAFVRDLAGLGAGTPFAPLIGSASAMIGAALGHFGPRLASRFGHGLRGRRGAERRTGAGLTVRIGTRDYAVRDWSAYGLFLEAPRDRFKPGQEVSVDLGLGADAKPLAAEVLRLGGSGVALRFTAIDADGRARLRRQLLERIAA